MFEQEAGFVEHFQEMVGGNAVAMSEFLGAVARVGRIADTTDDPLKYVATNVKDQVGDAVHRIVRTPPDLIL